MLKTYVNMRSAVTAGLRLAHKHGLSEVFITEIVSGEFAGCWCVTPDRLSERSLKVKPETK